MYASVCEVYQSLHAQNLKLELKSQTANRAGVSALILAFT